METQKTWILLIGGWVVLFIAYLIFWPPAPRGRVVGLLPVKDHSALLLQYQWKKGDHNPLHLCRVDENLEKQWIREVASAPIHEIDPPQVLWSDDTYGYLNLPQSDSLIKDSSYSYRVMAFDLATGEEQWTSAPVSCFRKNADWPAIGLQPFPHITGTDKYVISFHKFWPPYNDPADGNVRCLLKINAWEKATGKLVWSRSELANFHNNVRLPEQSQLFHPTMSVVLPKIEELTYPEPKKEVDGAFATQFNAVRLFPEYGILALQSKYWDCLLLDLDTGEEVWSGRNRYGFLAEDGLYYGKRMLGAQGEKMSLLVKFDLKTRKEVPLMWSEGLLPSPRWRVYEMYGIGTYQNLQIYTLSTFNEEMIQQPSPVTLYAVDPLKDSLVWSLPMSEDGYAFQPNPFAYTDWKEESSPLTGEMGRFIPLYGKASLSPNTVNSFNSYSFPVIFKIDLKKPSIHRTDPSLDDLFYQGWDRLLRTFCIEDRLYLSDGKTFWACIDGNSGTLQSGLTSDLVNLLDFKPQCIQDDRIWTIMGNEPLVFNATTLEVVSGPEDRFDNQQNRISIELGIPIKPKKVP